MMKSIRKLLRDQKGSALVLVSLMIALLMGVTGLVIDGGTLYVTKSHLAKAARASVLSGAQELVGDTAAVQTIVNNILDSHDEQGSLTNLEINPGHSVRVQLRREVPFTFMKLFGFSSAPVEVSAAAQILQMGRAQGAAPLGIDEGISLEFNKPYQLKVDQTEVIYGNFGILALSGPGAQTYEDNLRYGYSGEIKIGDVIPTQTGNVAGKTRTAINERITACPYLSGDIDHRDCPRVLLVPVYRPKKYANNQLQEIEVKGFAYFYILEPMTSQATYITGMFIKRVDTGYSDTNALDKGAYSIKLIE